MENSIAKSQIDASSDHQLTIFRYYFPNAVFGKKFKIRDEKTPSASLKKYKGIIFLNDFGDGNGALNCYNLVMEKEGLDFKSALHFIAETIFRTTLQYDGTFKLNSCPAKNYLLKRGIKVSNLPRRAYEYDPNSHSIIFRSSTTDLKNRRYIDTDKAPKYLNQGKLIGAVYDRIFKANMETVFITEGVINALSLCFYSAIALFSASNLIKHIDELRTYLHERNVILAFDNDDAGNKCATHYIDLILKSGIPIKSLKKLTLEQGQDINDLLVKGSLENHLNNPDNYEVLFEDAFSIHVGKVPKGMKNIYIENVVAQKYEFKFNKLKDQSVYRLKGSVDDYKPIDDYFIRTLKRKLGVVGLPTSTSNLKDILQSNFAQAIHPVHEFFENLKPWDEKTDHILKLAETIKVEDMELWYMYLQKWLVAVVANALSPYGCQNHTCLILTGPQGTYKTTWLQLLCPEGLNEYAYIGKIDPKNKDSLMLLSSNVLINIDDQLVGLNKSAQEELKHIITLPSIKYRRVHSEFWKDLPRIGSFMGSVNGKEFLSDPTGSRRFLPFDVQEIDIKATKAIDMNLVFAQAFHLFKEGFEYWFSQAEIAILYEHNAQFVEESIEEQLVKEFVEKPETKEEATHHLQPALLKTILEGYTKERLSARKLGMALKSQGFEKWQMTKEGVTKWVYSVNINGSLNSDLT